MKKLKIVLWIFSVFYVLIPAIPVWMVWTNQMTFREGLDLAGKLVLTATLFVVSFGANYVAWSNFLRWEKKWRRGGKSSNN